MKKVLIGIAIYLSGCFVAHFLIKKQRIDFINSLNTKYPSLEKTVYTNADKWGVLITSTFSWPAAIAGVILIVKNKLDETDYWHQPAN
jgi:hypothetical protein